MRAQFVMSEIGVGLRRNLTMTFAVIVSVALSLALAGGSWLGREQVTHMKGYWYDKVEVSIFLCNKLDQTENQNCRDKVFNASDRQQMYDKLRHDRLIDK